MYIVFWLFFAALLNWILIPSLRWFGLRFNILDHPNGRNVHKKVIPSTGGLAIYISFFGLIIIAYFINLKLQLIGRDIVILALTALFLVLVGIYDDIKNISSHRKFLLQIFISLIPIILGVRITTLVNPFGGIIHLGWISIPITLLWFLSLINVMNLIDGLDGLAAGIAVITAAALLLVSIKDASFSIMMACLIGVTLAFLKFNLSESRKILLGDNGSMLLGYLLAYLSIIGYRNGLGLQILIVTTLSLGVPIYDTAMAILRRLNRGVHIFTPDKEHIHHRLLNNGMAQREVVLIIYGLTLIFAMTGLYIVSLKNIYAILIIISSGVLALFIKRRYLLKRLTILLRMIWT